MKFLELEKVVSMFNVKNVIKISVGFACLQVLTGKHGHAGNIMNIVVR
jgi:hypothetical protein